jgi:hypothetical protein
MFIMKDITSNDPSNRDTLSFCKRDGVLSVKEMLLFFRTGNSLHIKEAAFFLNTKRKNIEKKVCVFKVADSKKRSFLLVVDGTSGDIDTFGVWLTKRKGDVRQNLPDNTLLVVGS